MMLRLKDIIRSMEMQEDCGVDPHTGEQYVPSGGYKVRLHLPNRSDHKIVYVSLGQVFDEETGDVRIVQKY